MGTKSTITSIFDSNAQEKMVDKIYPVYSNEGKQIITDEVSQILIEYFTYLNLNRYYDCLIKAKLTAYRLGISEIHLGSLIVKSTEENVAFGYAYNPPLELHAWLQIEDKIIDLALPGTIEMGLKSKDDVGYFLKDREPIILAGIPPNWIYYQTYEIVSIDKLNILSKEQAKKLLNKK